MPHFHFDVGDTMQGPLGLCARIEADTSEEAVTRLREVMGNEMEVMANGIEYVRVYFNPDWIEAKHIDEVVDRPAMLSEIGASEDEEEEP